MSVDIAKFLEQSRADRVRELPPNERLPLVRAACERYCELMQRIAESATDSASWVHDLGGPELTYPYGLGEELDPEDDGQVLWLFDEARAMARIVNDWTKDLENAALPPNEGEDFTAEEVELRTMLAGWGYEAREDGSMVNTADEQRRNETQEWVSRRTREQQAKTARAGFKVVPVVPGEPPKRIFFKTTTREIILRAPCYDENGILHGCDQDGED